MIKSIEFKDVCTVELPPDVNPSYEFSIAALKGRKFEFKPWLNVMVGENGSGKTSLLNVIRYLTFCDKAWGSSAEEGREMWVLDAEWKYQKGYWHLAELRNHYKPSVYNLLKSEDMSERGTASSLINIVLQWNESHMSAGENVANSISSMVKYFQEGYGAFCDSRIEQPDENGFLHHNYFTEMVIKPIERDLADRKKYQLVNSFVDPTISMWETMLDYYKRNNLTDYELKVDGDGYLGNSFLMDEPDKGMDINRVEELYEFLTRIPHFTQMIVVLHNIGMIHKLKQMGGVNFIELTEGYIDKVERFFASAAQPRRVGLVRETERDRAD